MRSFVAACVMTVVVAACGGAATPPASSIAATTSSAPATAAAATAAAATAAAGTATGKLNVTLSGGLTGTLTEVKSVGLCTDPTKTAGGYAASFSSALGAVPYSFQVGVGASYKGPGTYPTGGDVMVSVRGATIREIWDAAPGGTLTVAADGSGSVDTDLKSATGAPIVHAKGTFSCKR